MLGGANTPMLIGVPAPGTRYGLPGSLPSGVSKAGTPRCHLGSSACPKYPSCTAQHVLCCPSAVAPQDGCRLHHLNLQCRRRLVVSERCPLSTVPAVGSASLGSTPRVEPSGTGGTCFSKCCTRNRATRAESGRAAAIVFTAPHWLMAREF